MEQEPFQSLPRGWGIATLDEVALWGSGGTPSRKNPKFYEGSIPWVKTGELGPKYIRSAEEHITQEAIQRSSAKVFPPGSVGIAMYGATIGKLSIWAADLSTNQACAVAQPYQELSDTEFLYYFLLSQKRALIEAGKGGAQPNISQGILKAWPICLPPVNEQQRIVSKIEELFSELDKGVENLKTARAKLKVYRQAVLKYAFEGKLTAQWREENFATPWTQTTLGSQLSFLTSGSRGWAKFYAEHGDKFIRAQNLKYDRLDFADMAFVDLPDKSEGMRTRIQIGDLLITITGANVTKTAFVTSDIGTAYVSQHVALARPVEGSNTEFLYWYLVSEAAGRKQLTASAYGAGKPGLNLENIRSVNIPLPSAEEQTEIVSRINTILSIERSVSAQIDIQLARSDALRQSILKKAFSGQLVAQDPHDEPASVLLDRIKAEREKVAKNNHSKKTKKRKTTA